MQQQQRPERACEDQRTEFDAGELNTTTVMVSKHRQYRLLPADDGARELVEGPEGQDRA